ncbi:hypothetical protein BDV24DRAFT_114390 [Aspergillus arachidicola]|uniref:Uncharacterized protein n=1 Tax=Aspergillus arachidicola TaxID=656916 RepID=A0A5N6XVC3_9EURO|nr:hypothetical protein BDV24DRAFT_114390 [Aspergillus arachidicola]
MKAALCFFWALSLATVSSAWPQDQAATSTDIQRLALESSHEYSPAHSPFPDEILPSLETSFSPRLAIMKRDNNAEQPPSHCLRAREFPAEFDTLAISLKLANVDWAGTSSDVTISVTVNDKGKVPVFKSTVSPSVNAHQTISLKSADYFGAEKINLTDLKVLKIYAYHNGHIFDAFEGLQFNLEGIVLIATDNTRGISYNNVQFELINEWISPSSSSQPRKEWNLNDNQWHASKPGKASPYGN